MIGRTRVKAAVRRRFAPVARLTPGASSAYRAAQQERSIRRILASGLFDQDWYQLQTGHEYPNVKAALRHYLEDGRRASLTPSPLFNPSWYEPGQWRKRVADPLARYLFRPAHMYLRMPHVLFEPTTYLERYPSAEKHPAGPLGHFLASATDDSVLELVAAFGGPASVRYGTALRHQEATVKRWREQEGLRRARRLTSSFKADVERQFRDELAKVPDPAGVDGGPAVSVVMPVWNRSAMLRRAVESVQRQSFTDWELVVVDDGSTDDTPFVLQGLAAFDPRIRVIHESRSGVSHARNRAIEAARGRYIAFLDSDNVWEPDFLQLILRAMESRELPAAFSAMEVHAGDKVSYRAFEGTREHLLIGNHIDLNVLVVRADVLREVGGFSEDLRRTVDYDLVLKISAKHHLTYLPFIGAIYSQDAEDADRISVREPLAWDYVVRSRHAVDWAKADGAERVPGRLSVVIPVRGDAVGVHRCITALLQDAPRGGPGPDLEIIVVDLASPLGATLSLSAMELNDPRVRVERATVDLGYALGVDHALPLVTGEFTAVCDPQTTPRAGWAAPLLQALADPDVAVVQSLVTDADGTVAGAGATFTAGGGLPSPLLAGHPVEDAQRLGEIVPVPALLGSLWAARTADLVAVRGLDCLFTRDWHVTDLSLRIRERGGARLVTTSLADHMTPAEPEASPDDRVFRDRWHGQAPAEGVNLWERAGFDVVHHRVERDDELGRRRLVPVVARRSRTVQDGPGAGLPSLRWAIKTAAPAGPKGRTWGDWHFAQSLAAAFRELGQDAVVDAREATYRDTAFLDDVNLVIRGLDQVDPEEGRVNLLWIISHPELVTPQEVGGYDAVFAASSAWAQAASRRWHVDVQPLLQCTDPSRFRPDVAEPDTGAQVLFVGNSRGIYRPSVRCAMEADIPLTVYGSGWEPFLPQGAVAATSLPNESVAAEYAAAHVVLNDHWDDMRYEGFISNRIFDVVATGGRVISDDVPGIRDLFGGVVRTWSAPMELVQLLRTPLEESFPGRDERLAAAAAVARDHSFAARARQLLDVAVKRLESR
jgi:GT2 family glycosyltransferase